MSETVGEFVDLLNHEDYEILNVYPFTIRRKSNHYEVTENLHKTLGYYRVTLNRKKYLKHRLIAEQFIKNPDNLPQVDHINTNKTDNRLENLRWCSASDNLKNRSSHVKNIKAVYLNELPIDSIEIRNYHNFTFRDYYIDSEANIYRFNGARYYRLVTNKNIVYINDVDNKQHSFSLTGLRKAFL